MKLLMPVSITVFGSLGWWLGGELGIYGSLLFSTIGSLVGLYVAYKINQRIF